MKDRRIAIVVALAVLIGLAALSSGPVRARDAGYLAIKQNASICVDQSLPPPTRIAACSTIIDHAEHSSSVALKRIAALSYVARATAFQQQGDDQAALRDFNAAANKDPKSELPLLGLGNFYMTRSNFSLALQSYNRALAIAGKDPVIYDDRGAALFALDRNDEAVADFTRALAVDQQDTTALSNRATVYLRTDRAALAIADLTAVIRDDPKNARAFYNRGTAYETTQALDMALQDYRSAARLQPSLSAAYAGLGRVLARKDPQGALAELSDAIRRDPQSSELLRERAVLYLSLKQFEPALYDFDKAIAIDGSDVVAYLDRGVAEQQLGNPEMAIKDYTRSIELQNTAAAHIDRGSAYARLGDQDKALIDFEAALAIEPMSLPALIGQANANYTLAARDPTQLAASLKDYTLVIEAAPKNAGAYFVRGNIHFDLKDYAAALSDYSQSLALNPSQPAALFNRSLAEAHLGRSADAATDQRAAHELDASIGAAADSETAHAGPAATVTEYAAAPRTPAGAPGVGFAAPRAAPVEAETAESGSDLAPRQRVTIKGYRTVLMNGQERFCRTEVTLGSRADKRTVCLTQHQVDVEREDAQRLRRDIEDWAAEGPQVELESVGGATAMETPGAVGSPLGGR